MRALGGGAMAVAAVLALSAAASAAPVATHTATLTPLSWVPNGPVNAVAPFGKELIIGGSFTKLSQRTGQAALTDPTTGAPKAGLPEFAGGSVNAIVPDGAGGWYVGGLFQYVGGQSRTALVHLLPNGSVDSHFAPSLSFVYNVSPSNPSGMVADAGVTALALSGSTLYVGGSFDRADGAERNGLAAFDLSSGAITPWDPKATSSGNFVKGLAVSGGTVYVAGGFEGVGGASRNGLAALDATTGQATAWNPAPDQTATSLALGPGVLYVGGNFAQIAGASRSYLAAFDLSTGALTSWAPAVAAPVTAIAVAGDTVAAGSQVRVQGSIDRRGIVYDLASAGGAARWRDEADGSVAALAFDGSNVLVAGGFRTIGGVKRDGAAALDATGKTTGWAPQPNLLVNDFGEQSAVDALSVTGAGVVIGGDFATMGGVSRSGLAEIDPRAGGKPSSWHPRLSGAVSALTADAGHVYVAGRFTTVDGKVRHGGAAFDARLRLLPWNPPGIVAGTVDHLAILPGKVVMTGSFNGVAPSTELHGSIAAFDAVTGRLLTWGPSNLVADGIGPLLPAGGRIYTTFSRDSETVVRLDPTTGRMGKPLVHNNGTGDIYGFALSGRTLYLGGAMEAVDFAYRTRFAAIDAPSGKLLPWKPTADDSVFSVFASGRVVYAGGQFHHVGDQPRVGLAALDASTGAVLAWNPGLDGNVRALVPYPGGFAAIGSFLSVGGRSEPYLALFST